MRLKIYRAPSIPDAMRLVRGELGPEALILGTRRVAGGIELTAALEQEEHPPAGGAQMGTLDPGRPHRNQAKPAAEENNARQAALDFHGVPIALHDALWHGALDAALATALPFASLPLGADSPPLLLAGPPGAGKTLTAARLATRLVMAGVTPMVITADGKRAGATEQLAAFTRLLSISLIVACHPVTLGRALARRTRGAPVLIDAPGHDPSDPAQVEELAALAGATGATIVLVLPAGLDPAESADLAAAYAACGATLLVATRLDLARRLGGVLAAAAAGPLALTEAGIGPGAADGLVPLTPALLAERLMQGRPHPYDRHSGP
jgi:flagellar biosynthesis protein FlhF